MVHLRLAGLDGFEQVDRHVGHANLILLDAGTLHTLERSDAGGANKAFPTKLSETGLFAGL